jgi:septal ring factor EnvC (AmiA/AmiB activator)
LDIGFIAEELDALGLQNLVLYNDYGQPDGVMYDRTVIYLIPILREQQQRIAALEQEKAQNTTYLSALQAENAAMRQMLNELRADVNALKTATSPSTGSGSDRK